MNRVVGIIVRYVLTLWVASVAVFALLRVVPGDPAEIALGVTATPELVAEKRAALGIDQPLLTQYGQWVKGMLTGDFGLSMTSGKDISELVLDRLQVSLILVVCAIIVSLAIAIPMGSWAARRHRHADGIAITATSQVGIAIPSFLAGIVLVTVFAVKLGWVPANGWVPPNVSFTSFLSRLFLPVMALAAVQSAIMTRYVRSAVLNILSEDFIRTARAKGLTTKQALRRHGLRNAALPVVTVTGLQLATVVVGAVVIEKVFVLPGIGTMLLDAVTTRDPLTVQTIVMLLVAFTIIVNLVVDLLYVVLDPRIRS